MLKLIRKYQLIILAIGGSLLMVVFLFEPIIGRLSPDPRKATVGQLEDGTKFDGFDFQNASADLAILKVVAPLLLLPDSSGGLGIEQGSGDTSELHWLLLTKQAQDAGLIGDAGEGMTWIQDLARRNALIQLQQQVQQGNLQFNSQFELQQAIESLATQYEGPITRNISLAAGRTGATEADVYRTLAKARGVDRLYNLFKTLPAYSDLGLMTAAQERFDTVAVNAVLIKGESFVESIPVPSDAELQTFFDQYKDQAPQDNDLRIGYTQPARVKLGWLSLNKQIIQSSIEPDRVELRKTWTLDRKLPEDQRKYPGDFAGERAKIAGAYTESRAMDIMIEADKIIRAKVLATTQGLKKDGDYYELPEDWDSKRPKLEDLAQSVVTGLKEQLQIDIPLPTVEMHTDRWLTNQDIAFLPGFGGAAYRVGSRAIRTPALPNINDTEESAELMTIQEKLPLVDPAAEDQVGNRYYAVLYEIRPAGPADSIEDAGYDRVLRDYRTVKAYEMLNDNLPELLSQAQSTNELSVAIDTAVELGDDDTTRPGIARNILVGSQSVIRGRLASFVEPGLNTEAFRNAVIEATKDIDPLTPPQTIAESPIYVTASIPIAKSVAIAEIVAPRPITVEDFQAQLGIILTNESGSQIQTAVTETQDFPFTLDTLSNRYGYVRVKKRADEEFDESNEDASETQSETESASADS
ncbi:MAG: hypothetical protein JJ974_05090 [Phycisphaerales bacterium]|nr:hypothetical protein [Phycisphaerales bacterium]